MEKTPLSLKSRGSFFVGGEFVDRSCDELGSYVPSGKIVINQMYVQYMEPCVDEADPPIIFVHGMSLSGKTWETTPDGRMGWDEYFVRRGHGSYVVDQVSRGRSGFDPAMFNRVRVDPSGASNLPPLVRFSSGCDFTNFRLGATPGNPYPDCKFPLHASDEYFRQELPDLNAGLPDPNPTVNALAKLSAKLGGAILMTHSQSGIFTPLTALEPEAAIRAMILIEPGVWKTEFNSAALAKLSRIPTLIVFGDYLQTETHVPSWNWQVTHDNWINYVDAVNKAGGAARMLDLPEIGIRGNSHMLMQDTNNLDIADIILDWIKANVHHGCGCERSSQSSTKP